MLQWPSVHLRRSISPLSFHLDLTNQVRYMETKLGSYKKHRLPVQELGVCNP